MILFTKTYNGIIKGFTKTIADLRLLSETNARKAGEKTEKVLQLRDERDMLYDEGSRATATADKLAALLE